MNKTIARQQVAELLRSTGKPVKSYTQLLIEGVPHKGGLAQLALAETMENPPPSIAALKLHRIKWVRDS